ncbi:chromate resistance protein [Neisseriaceae bacterium JH1-16]|nr:chromate resistance protein [Neisseriaceae bacterium JH1-16]
MKMNRDWIILILSLPTQPANARLRAWRALKGMGGSVLRDGVYLLPNIRDLAQRLEEVGVGITESGGVAHLLALDARDAEQQRFFEDQFDRSAEYGQFIEAVKATGIVLATTEASVLNRTLNRFQKGLNVLAETDFFPGDAYEQAVTALEDLKATVSEILSPGEPHMAPGRVKRLVLDEFQQQTWATRRRPWVDRLASAWLIQRFIDRQATILWLTQPSDCPAAALGFDFDGASFTHIGAKVTFEVLAASFGLDSDPAIASIAGMVHFLDVGGVPVPEASGLKLVLSGLHRQHEDDDELLRAAARVFDALYAAHVPEPVAT